jgi:hypothetical protein
MSLGEFEPDVWLPRTHPAVLDRVIGLGELAGLDVIHGPRCLGAVTYDLWLAVIRASHPGFGFTDPPFRRSLPMTNSTYRRRRKTVSTAKKPYASRLSAWARRNFRQEVSRPQGGPVTAGAEDTPDSRHADLVAEADRLAVHPAVSRGRVLPASRSTRSRICWPATGRPGRSG